MSLQYLNDVRASPRATSRGASTAILTLAPEKIVIKNKKIVRVVITAENERTNAQRAVSNRRRFL